MKLFLPIILRFFLLGAPALLCAQFVEKAQSTGMDAGYPTFVGGHTEPGLDPYAVGSASAACDLNGDGWPDLIIARAGAPCQVFINNRDGTFREEAATRGLDAAADIGGIGVGDLDNDGDPDVVMVPVSGPRYFLFLNDGTGRYREAAVERGADVTVTGEILHHGQTVSLVDYDRNGYLDIHIAEWSVLTNSRNEMYSALLHNRGRAAPAYFENRTAAAGLVQPVIKTLMAGYANLWADYDGDGYPDVFLAADYGSSQFYWNNGDGTFTNGTEASGTGNRADNMGVTLLDYNGDGKIDIFTSAISLTNESSFDKGFISDNKLFRNNGGRNFTEVAFGSPIRETGWGWGAQSLDANNDGRPDLAVTNGYVAPGPNFAVAKIDPTKLFLNNGGTFTDTTTAYGIKDTGLGRSLVILDYDNDGREDIFITQSEGHRILYRNEGAVGAHWLNLRFTGTVSNRDGYGAEVTITSASRTQVAVYNPTNSYIGQREPRLHFGLGADTTVSKVTIKWPSGTVQELTNLSADQTLSVTESAALPSAPPTFLSDPVATAVSKDGRLVLSANAQGSPVPLYNWFKDGVRITGQTGSTLTIEPILPIDAGTYTVTATNVNGSVTSKGAVVTVTANLGAKSVARWWNEALIDGIRKDTPNPPVHARNLYHLSAAFWDSCWAYERDGWATRREIYVKETPVLPADEAGRMAAQSEAMSYAAYTVIKARYALSPGAGTTLAGIRWLMQQYGYNPDRTDATGGSPSAVGLRIGQQVLASTLNDGANEANNYKDASGYITVNPPLIVRNPGVGPGVDPDFWQPLDLVNTITQNGIVLGAATQKFVGSNAINTRTFALVRGANRYLLDDPGPPPTFNGSTKAAFITQAAEVITYSSQLSPADGATVDISPGKLLNNPLGTNGGRGRATNPATGQAYPGNTVLRGDYSRVLAEFWADGPASETPPGHWNVLFNQVTDHAQTTRKFLGTGAALRLLEWDVGGYLALNGALHDAACAAWTLKWEYDSSRPITMIRYLAGLGQSSDATLPSYNASGLPLVPGQIELITAQTAAAGQRHSHLAGSIGQIAVKSWLGTPANATLTAGVGWILGVNWMPYQRETFVTPAFPGYVSGHSTFSRSAAEVLARYTGSAYFPGGLAIHDSLAGTGLGFEAGPSANVQLQWATYFDAADQAGLSRLFGGIHIAADDFIGRRTGAKVGADAFTKFLQLYNPAIGAQPVVTQQPEHVTLTSDGTTYFQVIAVSPSGLGYQWQRKPNGQTAWADVANGSVYSGATTPILTIAAGSGNTSGDSYRVNVTSSGGTVTSNAATWSITGSLEPAPAPAPTPTPAPSPSPASGGGGGGGAPSVLFYALLIVVSAARWLGRRRDSQHVT